MVLSDIFPWANLEIDSDFYYDYDEENFMKDCPYDKEDDKYYYEPEDLERHMESLPLIRPYEVLSGELAKYRFKLSINNIGNAFLTLDNYIAKTNN